MQNNIPTVHISEIHYYIVKNNKQYLKTIKNNIYRVAMATLT